MGNFYCIDREKGVYERRIGENAYEYVGKVLLGGGMYRFLHGTVTMDDVKPYIPYLCEMYGLGASDTTPDMFAWCFFDCFYNEFAASGPIDLLTAELKTQNALKQAELA